MILCFIEIPLALHAIIYELFFFVLSEKHYRAKGLGRVHADFILLFEIPNT